LGHVVVLSTDQDHRVCVSFQFSAPAPIFFLVPRTESLRESDRLTPDPIWHIWSAALSFFAGGLFASKSICAPKSVAAFTTRAGPSPVFLTHLILLKSRIASSAGDILRRQYRPHPTCRKRRVNIREFFT
jgi:hypothetical protein